MTAPNLLAPTTVTGKVKPYVVTTSLASALSNAVDSGQCLKVLAVRVTNTGSTLINISVSHYRGSTHTYAAKSASVIGNTALVVTQRDEVLYLEEGDALYMQASAATADALITYEIWA